MRKSIQKPLCVAAALVCLVSAASCTVANEKYENATFAMDTLVTQTAYGPRATAAMQEVNQALAEFEEQFSLYSADGDIARINKAAGTAAGAVVQPETAGFLQRALALTAQSEDAFAITIGRVTLAWGVNSGSPHILTQNESDALLEYVDDSAVRVEDGTVYIDKEGVLLDLGGIAKGEACSLAEAIYEKHNVKSAMIWIGGNTYTRGTKPDGSPWVIGFRDPYIGGNAYMASFEMVDDIIAVSDGSERFFEGNDDEVYIHIMDPRTGRPAQSDIASVGVVHKDGATADFWSTTLYVWGVERTLEHMRQGGRVILLDMENNLYVSQALQEGFTLYDDSYNLIFIAEE